MPFGKDSRVVTSCGCFPLSSSTQSSNPDREQKIQLQQEVLIFDFSTGEVGKGFSSFICGVSDLCPKIGFGWFKDLYVLFYILHYY